MGIKYLWTVLAPFCDRKPLYELQGKTVAVDLSCWICEAQNIADYQVQPRMYLRNLFFRACYLLLMDVNPVFVLEGTAPELKFDTILARNAIQFKGAKPKTDKVKTGKDRTRFHYVLRQCEEMLSYIGLACIKGKGEAESLCAYLNEDGLVDGCISQDSDCFAYGAQVVYRNFSISTQGAQAASGGAVDVYDIRKANHNLSFGRNKIIAMALLTGCDYSDGVHGVGKDSVLKFFETVSDDDVLDKLRSWRESKSLYKNYEKQLADKNICTSCGHSGKVQAHTKTGCVPCKTTTGCDPFKFKNERLKMKNEVNIRNRAIKDPNFPNEALIKEFLDRKDDVRELDLKWKQPNVVKFLKFTTKFLQWEELYAFEKLLPMLTRWQCRNPELLKDENELRGVVKPVRIKKVRNPKGVSSYEIIWSDPEECFKGLIPECQILENNVDVEKLWSTIEPQKLVENAYPRLVDNFRQSKIKSKTAGKRKKNKNIVDEIAEKFGDVSISESKGKKARKPRAAIKKTNGKRLKVAIGTAPNDLDSSLNQAESIQDYQTRPVRNDVESLNSSFRLMTIERQPRAAKSKTGTLDVFIKNDVANSSKKTKKANNEYLSGNNTKYPNYVNTVTSSTSAKMTEPFDIDVSSFGDESDLELSGIIDDIISRNDIKEELKLVADKYVRSCEKNGGKIEDLKRSDVIEREHPDDFDQLENRYNIDEAEHYDALKKDTNEVSCFFVTNPGDENDLFEKTFNETIMNLGESSGSDTEEYEYPPNDLAGKADHKNSKKITLMEDGSGERSGIFLQEDKGNIILSSDDDSFEENYVPLYERLKSLGVDAMGSLLSNEDLDHTRSVLLSVSTVVGISANTKIK